MTGSYVRQPPCPGCGDRKPTTLQSGVGPGHRWLAMLDGGKAKTPADIARLEAMNIVQVREILRLTLLAPDIIEAIVDARAPRRLTLELLLRRSIPGDWEEQRRLMESVAYITLATSM